MKPGIAMMTFKIDKEKPSGLADSSGNDTDTDSDTGDEEGLERIIASFPFPIASLRRAPRGCLT